MLKFSDKEKAGIGLLVPHSKFIPQAGQGFINGLYLALTLHGENINEDNCQLIVENIEDGSINITKQKVEKLLFTDRVDIVLGLISYRVAEEVSYLFKEHNKLFLIANVGGHMMADSFKEPFIFCNTLQSWQHNHFFGEWSVNNIGNRAMIFTSLYDSGFDNNTSFNHSFSKNGGEIMGQHVTHVQSETHNIEESLGQFDWKEIDWLMAGYIGEKSFELIEKVLDINPDLKVGMSPMAIAYNIPDKYKGIKFKTFSAAIGSFDQKNDVYKEFEHNCQKYFKGSAGAFELLGYESGKLVLEAFDLAFIQKMNFTDQLEQLRKFQMESPRGRVKMNASTQSLEGTLSVREVLIDNGEFTVNTIAEKDSVEEDEELDVLRNQFKSSWLHPYGF